MVEQSKAPEVELDTDGVNEESVEIKETPKEPDATELPKQEVDLGYTDHEGKRTNDQEKDHGTDISYENERETKLEEKPESRCSALVALNNYDNVVNLLKFIEKGLSGKLTGFELMWHKTYKTMLDSSENYTPLLPSTYPFYVFII